MITGFGAGGVDATLSEDKTYVEVIVTGPQPRRYRIRVTESDQLEIVNMEDSSFLVEEIERMIGTRVWANVNQDYEGYELMGTYEAAEYIAKYIGDNFARKD